MILKILLLPTIFYFFLGCLIRFLGKREIGQLGVFDLIILLMIADISVIGIEDNNNPFYYYLIGITILCLSSKLIDYIMLKSKKIRDKLDCSYSVIIANGKINFNEMKKNLYNLDDLLTGLRKNGVNYITDVKLAVLENDGTLSVYNNDFKDIPLPVIIDGKIQNENLCYMNLNKNDVLKRLKENNECLSDVFFAYLNNGRLIIVKNV